MDVDQFDQDGRSAVLFVTFGVLMILGGAIAACCCRCCCCSRRRQLAEDRRRQLQVSQSNNDASVEMEPITETYSITET